MRLWPYDAALPQNPALSSGRSFFGLLSITENCLLKSTSTARAIPKSHVQSPSDSIWTDYVEAQLVYFFHNSSTNSLHKRTLLLTRIMPGRACGIRQVGYDPTLPHCSLLLGQGDSSSCLILYLISGSGFGEAWDCAYGR